MADLLLSRGDISTRGEVSRLLRRRLRGRGLELHERTIRRHLSGEVVSIPPEVEEVMSELLLERTSLASPDAIDKALVAEGFDLPSDEERFPLVKSEEFLPFVHLWLHLNPGRSKRWLACRLRDDLAREGLSFVVGSLESLLSGKGMVVRREIHSLLLEYLQVHDLETEDEAKQAADDLAGSIEHSLQGRELVDSERFQLLCGAWQLRHHEASARRLSRMLKQRLRDRGIRMSLNRLQKSIAGKTQRVRRVLVEIVEELLTDELPDDTGLDQLLEQVRSSPERLLDLLWVDARPIAKMAEEWLAERTDTTTRQLAIRVSETLEKMGFSRGHNAIQPVLGGWKKKTRGFVYRAMLAQFEGADSSSIPDEHILEPAKKLVIMGIAPQRDPTESIRPPNGADTGKLAEAYLREMREHVPSAMADNFVAFAAFRAERLYGIPRKEAARMIRGRRPIRLDAA